MNNTVDIKINESIKSSKVYQFNEEVSENLMFFPYVKS